MGMNLFTSHSTTPTATIAMITVVSGISSSPFHFPDAVRAQGVVEKLRAFESLSKLAIRKRRAITPLHTYCSKAMEK
jgi:hypothetical protein